MPTHRVASSRPASYRQPRDRLLGLARRFWYSIRRWWWSAYFRIDVSGLEHVPARGGVLLCGNHASHLDAPAILAALPRDLALRASTAAAKDVFGDAHPLADAVGRLTTNSLPIEREADFAKGLRVLERVLTDGRPLVLFPEGKRSSTGDLLPFKPGAAMLAIRTGTPIVPVRLDGVNKALPKGSRLPDRRRRDRPLRRAHRPAPVRAGDRGAPHEPPRGVRRADGSVARRDRFHETD